MKYILRVETKMKDETESTVEYYDCPTYEAADLRADAWVKQNFENAEDYTIFKMSIYECKEDREG